MRRNQENSVFDDIDNVVQDTVRFLEARGETNLAREYLSFLTHRLSPQPAAWAVSTAPGHLAQRFADRLCLEGLTDLRPTTAPQEDITLELFASEEAAPQAELLALVRTSRERRALIDISESAAGWRWAVSTERSAFEYRGFAQLARDLQFVRAPELIANEATALWNLQFLSSAQATYQTLYDGAGFAPLRELGQLRLIDAELSCGTKHGYLFEAMPAEQGDDLYIYATPLKYGASGRRSFMMGVRLRSICVDDCGGDQINFSSPSLRLFRPRLRLSLCQQS